MAYIGNSPTSETVLRLEARKSFALGLYIQDANGRPLDITDASIRLVAKKLPLRATDTNDGDFGAKGFHTGGQVQIDGHRALLVRVHGLDVIRMLPMECSLCCFLVTPLYVVFQKLSSATCGFVQ